MFNSSESVIITFIELITRSFAIMFRNSFPKKRTMHLFAEYSPSAAARGAGRCNAGVGIALQMLTLLLCCSIRHELQQNLQVDVS